MGRRARSLIGRSGAPGSPPSGGGGSSAAPDVGMVFDRLLVRQPEAISLEDLDLAVVERVVRRELAAHARTLRVWPDLVRAHDRTA